MCAVDDLLDGSHRLGLARVVLHGADVRGLRHVAARQRDHGAGHRRGEEHGLAGGRRHREDLLDVRQEAEVEHLVGLVEYEPADVRQVEVSAGGEVDKTTGRTDDDLDATLECLDLRLEGAATVDLDDADTAALGGCLEVGGDLDGELTRRHDDHGLWLALGCRDGGVRRFALHGDAGEERDAETERLSGAGTGLADDVVARKGHGQRHRLDGEGVDDALVGQGRHDVGVDPEVGERLGGDGLGGGLGLDGGDAGRIEFGRARLGLGHDRASCRAPGHGCHAGAKEGRSEVFSFTALTRGTTLGGPWGRRRADLGRGIVADRAPAVRFSVLAARRSSGCGR